jgi:hypothetical protein
VDDVAAQMTDHAPVGVRRDLLGVGDGFVQREQQVRHALDQQRGHLDLAGVGRRAPRAELALDVGLAGQLAVGELVGRGRPGLDCRTLSA